MNWRCRKTLSFRRFRNIKKLLLKNVSGWKVSEKTLTSTSTRSSNLSNSQNPNQKSQRLSVTCHDRCLLPRNHRSRATQLRLNLQVKYLTQMLPRNHVLIFQVSKKTSWAAKTQWSPHPLWSNITSLTTSSLTCQSTKLTSLTCSSNKISTQMLASLEESQITSWRAPMKTWFHTVPHSWISRMIRFLRLSAKMISSLTRQVRLRMIIIIPITSHLPSESIQPTNNHFVK